MTILLLSLIGGGLYGSQYLDTSSGDGEPGSYAGQWMGPVDQPGAAAYSMDLTLSEDGGSISGTVQYPELSCGGTWRELSRTSTAVVIEERITSNSAGRCVLQLEATISLNDSDRLIVDGGDWFAELSRG
jgi:hypothetical protein